MSNFLRAALLVLTMGGCSIAQTNTPPSGGAQSDALAQSASHANRGAKYTADFDWSQKPSTDLSVLGAKTAELSSCPLGVNGSESEYWVYISGEGKPEAVKVTGGTCNGDGRPGTLQFTTVNAHGRGYTLGSASDGLQEASIAARARPANSKMRPEGGRVIVSPGADIEIHARVSIRAAYQTIDFSGTAFNCYMDDDCIMVGDPEKSIWFRNITLIAPSGRPQVPGGSHPMIEVNAQKTRIIDVSTRSGEGASTFGSYVQVDDDQAFLLDGLDTGGAKIKCDETFCGSYVTAPGPFNKWSAVGWLKNMNVSPGCHGNGIDWQSGNTLRVSDSVIQGFHQFGVRTGHGRGGYGGTELDNVYMEVGNACGAAENGAAGAIVQGGMLTVRSERTPTGTIPKFQDLGSNFYAYFIVLNHPTLGDSVPLPMGWAKTDGSTPVPVSWPVVRGVTGTGRYKLLRARWDGKGFKPAISGSGDWLIATIDPASCNPARCKFTDTHASPKTFTSVSTLGGAPPYFPMLDFWPGNIILASARDTQNLSAPAKLFTDLATDGIVSVGRYVDGPAVFSEFCSYGSTGYAASIYPARSCSDPGAPTYGLKRGWILQSQSAQSGNSFANYKGRLNFLTTGSGPAPLITWEDSTPEKTLSHILTRPSAELTDSDSGMFAKGIQYTRANLEIRNYVGTLPDKANWKERLTGNEKSFAVPVTIAPGNTLTVGSGSPLSQMKMFSTKPVERRPVPPQSCIDLAGAAPGLTANDMVTGIKPPAPLGNLSVTGYTVAADSVNLHFCNASTAAGNVPAGSYSFLAVH
ncbi:MAG TPA: hypothetical protein VH088_08555 [Terriglobales bacterium]|jgi:hypothetical protein|nr:hypothetical protein [Terriglobales bacterium]